MATMRVELMSGNDSPVSVTMEGGVVYAVAYLALLLAPLVFVACLVQEINPFRAFAAFWRTLTALRGTEFELGKNEHSIEVRIT